MGTVAHPPLPSAFVGEQEPSAHILGLRSEPSERKRCWKTLLASGICVINHLDLMTKRWLICRSAKPTRGIAAATKGDALG